MRSSQLATSGAENFGRACPNLGPNCQCSQRTRAATINKPPPKSSWHLKSSVRSRPRYQTHLSRRNSLFQRRGADGYQRRNRLRNVGPAVRYTNANFVCTTPLVGNKPHVRMDRTAPFSSEVSRPLQVRCRLVLVFFIQSGCGRRHVTEDHRVAVRVLPGA